MMGRSALIIQQPTSSPSHKYEASPGSSGCSEKTSAVRQPAAHTSTAAVCALARRRISGARYHRVLTYGVKGAGLASAPAARRASPKSQSLRV